MTSAFSKRGPAIWRITMIAALVLISNARLEAVDKYTGRTREKRKTELKSSKSVESYHLDRKPIRQVAPFGNGKTHDMQPYKLPAEKYSASDHNRRRDRRFR